MMPFALLTPHNAPLLRSRWVHDNWQRTCMPGILRQVRAKGFGSVDLLYIENPAQAFWLDVIRHRVSVARVMDRMSGFERYPAEMQRLHSQLLASVDIVAYSALDLLPDLKAAGARATLHLPNGTDYRHFAEGDPAVPDDMSHIRHPIAIYAGAIDEWFDFDALDAMAEAMPDVSFVLVGPDTLIRRRLPARPNVHVLGWRPFGALPAYLRHADVGIIPFNRTGHPDLVNAIHPLKLYEYLASGLPVVASRWDELERLQSPAVLVDGPEDFRQGIRAVLANRRARRQGSPSLGKRTGVSAFGLSWGRSASAGWPSREAGQTSTGLGGARGTGSALGDPLR